MHRFGQGLDHFFDELRIVSDHLPRRNRAAELKWNFELGHVDDHLHAGIFALKLSRFGYHRKIRLAIDYRCDARRRAADHDRSNIFVVNAESAESQPHSEVR